MSKVSAKSAETIYLLSKKSNQHKEALIDIAEEIKKGAGSRRIEQLVNNMVLGEKQSSLLTALYLPVGKMINYNFPKMLMLIKKNFPSIY